MGSAVPVRTVAMNLAVSEIFGPTIQGEGQHVGRPAVFLRLSGCNLMCKWCDTPYTWAFTARQAAHHNGQKTFDIATERRSMSIKEIVEGVASHMKHDHTCVVVSGGEPLLQWRALREVLRELSAKHDPCIEVETAGTIQPEYLGLHPRALGIRWNVSPKLLHSGNLKHKRFKPEVLKWFAQQRTTTFKFVVQQPKDFVEIADIAYACAIRRDQIMIMAEGTTTEEQIKRMREIAPLSLRHGYALTPRLHTLLWDDERGR